jgi:hypothetical protein
LVSSLFLDKLIELPARRELTEMNHIGGRQIDARIL